MAKRLKYRVLIREITTIDRLFEVHAVNDLTAHSMALSAIESGNYRELPVASTKHDATPITITREI